MTETRDVAETAGEVLIVRSAADSLSAVRVTAASLPGHLERTTVLTTSAVTGRGDFFARLAEVLTEHLGGSAGGVKLVALGDYAASATVVDHAQELADWIGQDVVLPVPALNTEDRQPATWVLCEPGRPARPLPDAPAGSVWVTAAGHILVLTNLYREDGRPTPAR